ncbi:MAG TPA: pyrroline-5-carboxylate reductase [Aquifex aeolicus]|uniref:Pyrroline-5-carboxylate reductase n=1 Tax=Aquifex aeolicus TaxID=63363 RepID=A0A9D0YML7_AQUAO|nr:pyrroline-5-carboxylate reductase [Aquificales bacterium]HIP97755.1 pyrroline-5-carboxylate reductase [Aquifex aeolicus]HIQ25772.1 pyrroline-5-carboxylate reductase [Aquifex aeolicus]
MGKIGFIGFGNMGRAIAEGFLKTGNFSKEDFIVSVNSAESKEKLQREGFKVASTDEVVKESEVIFLAVKPKDLPTVVSQIKELPLLEKKVFISICAGVELKKLQQLFGKENIKLVRAMPNINVKVGKGVWALTFGENFSTKDIEKIKKLLAPTGLILEVEESLIDSVTALAGSGPAFVAEILDAFAQGGVKLGFKYETALKIAVSTFLGTISLMEEEDLHPAILRDRVTSPSGTTIYGLSKLNKEGMKGTIVEVLEEAYKRAKGLS